MERKEERERTTLCSLNNSAQSQICIPHSGKQNVGSQPELPSLEDKRSHNYCKTPTHCKQFSFKYFNCTNTSDKYYFLSLILFPVRSTGNKGQCFSALLKQCLQKWYSDPPLKLVLISREVFNRCLSSHGSGISKTLSAVAPVPGHGPVFLFEGLLIPETTWKMHDFLRVDLHTEKPQQAWQFPQGNILCPLLPSQPHLPNFNHHNVDFKNL